MRVLIINTSEKAGGAAVAAHRLTEALNNNGVKAKMLVRDKQSDALTVVALPKSPLLHWHFLWERLVVWLHLRFSRRHLFEVDLANAGTDITRLREFQEADVIHLHWVNQGMLSLKGIRKILDSGKPVVWTMHDIWPATAICHLTLGCRNFKNRCQNCRYLPGNGSANDLSSKVWKKKKAMLDGHNVFFVACSRWLESEARQSALLRGQKTVAIPNPLNTSVFHATDKGEARRQLQLPEDKQLVLFVSQRVTNPNKGMDYLVEACQQLAASRPEMVDDTAVVLLGGHAEEVEGLLPFKTYPLGYISDEHKTAQVYSAADVFVLPSLSENLPNTIMEAMACGVPCVGFNVGGIPEEIDHKKNGYVAAYRDATDLANGLHWVLREADRAELGRQAVKKVAHSYSLSNVAIKYTEVYNQAMALKHYRL